MPGDSRGNRTLLAGQDNWHRTPYCRHESADGLLGPAERTWRREEGARSHQRLEGTHPNLEDSLSNTLMSEIEANAAERQASAGARDGVKGKRNDLGARAPLHALVGRHRVGEPTGKMRQTKGKGAD